MDLKQIKIDPSFIDSGEWMVGPEDVKFLVRGIACAAAQQSRQKLIRNLPRTEYERDMTLPTAVAERITTQVLIDAVLLDWEGIAEDGVVLEYSKEAAARILFDPGYVVLRGAVLTAASIVQNGRLIHDEVLTGNSKAP